MRRIMNSSAAVQLVLSGMARQVVKQKLQTRVLDDPHIRSNATLLHDLGWAAGRPVQAQPLNSPSATWSHVPAAGEAAGEPQPSASSADAAFVDTTSCPIDLNVTPGLSPHDRVAGWQQLRRVWHAALPDSVLAGRELGTARQEEQLAQAFDACFALACRGIGGKSTHAEAVRSAVRRTCRHLKVGEDAEGPSAEAVELAIKSTLHWTRELKPIAPRWVPLLGSFIGVQPLMERAAAAPIAAAATAMQYYVRIQLSQTISSLERYGHVERGELTALGLAQHLTEGASASAGSGSDSEGDSERVTPRGTTDDKEEFSVALALTLTQTDMETKHIVPSRADSLILPADAWQAMPAAAGLPQHVCDALVPPAARQVTDRMAQGTLGADAPGALIGALAPEDTASVVRLAQANHAAVVDSVLRMRATCLPPPDDLIRSQAAVRMRQAGEVGALQNALREACDVRQLQALRSLFLVYKLLCRHRQLQLLQHIEACHEHGEEWDTALDASDALTAPSLLFSSALDDAWFLGQVGSLLPRCAPMLYGHFRRSLAGLTLGDLDAVLLAAEKASDGGGNVRPLSALQTTLQPIGAPIPEFDGVQRGQVDLDSLDTQLGFADVLYSPAAVKSRSPAKAQVLSESYRTRLCTPESVGMQSSTIAALADAIVASGPRGDLWKQLPLWRPQAHLWNRPRAVCALVARTLTDMQFKKLRRALQAAESRAGTEEGAAGASAVWGFSPRSAAVRAELPVHQAFGNSAMMLEWPWLTSMSGITVAMLDEARQEWQAATLGEALDDAPLAGLVHADSMDASDSGMDESGPLAQEMCVPVHPSEGRMDDVEPHLGSMPAESLGVQLAAATSEQPVATPEDVGISLDVENTLTARGLHQSPLMGPWRDSQNAQAEPGATSKKATGKKSRMGRPKRSASLVHVPLRFRAQFDYSDHTLSESAAASGDSHWDLDREQRTVFVGNLPVTASTDDLYNAFARCGQVSAVHMMDQRAARLRAVLRDRFREYFRRSHRRVQERMQRLVTDAQSQLGQDLGVLVDGTVPDEVGELPLQLDVEGTVDISTLLGVLQKAEAMGRQLSRVSSGPDAKLYEAHPLHAFVTFDSAEAAAAASSAALQLFGVVIRDTACKVLPASTARVVHVSGLPTENNAEMSSMMLEQLLSVHGVRYHLRVLDTQRLSPLMVSNGTALLEMPSHRDAALLVASLHGAVVGDGRTITAGWGSKQEWRTTRPRMPTF